MSYKKRGNGIITNSSVLITNRFYSTSLSHSPVFSSDYYCIFIVETSYFPVSVLCDRPLCLPAERDTATPSTNDKCTNSSTVIYRGRSNTSASTDSLSHAIASYEIAAGRLFTSNKGW